TTCRAPSSARRSSRPPARRAEPSRRSRSSCGSSRRPDACRCSATRSTTSFIAGDRATMIKLGRISYVNMAPVFYRVDAEVEEVQGVPTVLNEMLVSGILDTAPISSIEYARNADRLRLLPRLCVASEGAVDSIHVVARVPLARVGAGPVPP